MLGTDGTIYVGAEDGNFYALGPGGAQTWAQRVGGNPTSAGLGADGTIYVGFEKVVMVDNCAREYADLIAWDPSFPSPVVCLRSVLLTSAPKKWNRRPQSVPTGRFTLARMTATCRHHR